VVRKVSVKLLIPLWLLLWVMPSYGELIDRIVAIVNEDVITLSELDEAVSPYAQQIRSGLYDTEKERQMLFKVRHDILERMIDRKVTEQQGKKLGVSVSETDVDHRIEQIKEERYYTEKELKKVLSAEGYTLEEYRKQIRGQLLGIKLINIEVKSKIAVTEEEIQDYYAGHKDVYGEKKKYHLRTILVRVPSWQRGEDKLRAQNKTEAIAIQLRSGMPFEEVAKKYSADETAKDGGDIGWFSIEELSTELQETVRWMDQGDVSPALETAHGYQILLLEEIKESAVKTLKEARMEIQERIYRDMVEERYDTWLKDLRADSYIKVVQ